MRTILLTCRTPNMIKDDYSCSIPLGDSVTGEEREGFVNFLWDEVSYIRSAEIKNSDGTTIEGALICMKNGDTIAVAGSAEVLARIRSKWLHQYSFHLTNRN